MELFGKIAHFPLTSDVQMHRTPSREQLIKLVSLIAKDLKETTISWAIEHSYVPTSSGIDKIGFKLYYKPRSSLAKKEVQDKVRQFIVKNLKPLCNQITHYMGHANYIQFQKLEKENFLESEAKFYISQKPDIQRFSFSDQPRHTLLIKVSDIPLETDLPIPVGIVGFYKYLQLDIDVFISHSSKDKKLATKLSDYLFLLGYGCFVAHDTIHGGADWSDKIKDKLNNMRVFMPCLSDNFQNSVYCHQECGYAVARLHQLQQKEQEESRHLKIVPLKFGNKDPMAMLGGVQAIKVSEKITGTHLARIVEAIDPPFTPVLTFPNSSGNPPYERRR